MGAGVAIDAFRAGVAEKLGFYVYLLIDPRDHTIFYVGKGTANRCFAHLVEARKTIADSVADYAKLVRIREIERSGSNVRIDILRHGLSEPEAFIVESAAIDLLNMQPIENRVAGRGIGRMSNADINALYGAVPVENGGEHRTALIRINRQFVHGMMDDALYEATRKWWRIATRRTQLGEPWSPDWAMALYGGIIRAVYRIDSWEQPNDEELRREPTLRGRWSFNGRQDVEMEARYLYGNVSRYASQNPVCFVNCPLDLE